MSPGKLDHRSVFLDTESEITQFFSTRAGEEYGFRFDIPVDYFLDMDAIENWNMLPAQMDPHRK